MLESKEEAFEGIGVLSSFKANSYRIFARPWSSRNHMRLWLTSCHKTCMTTRYITLGYWRLMPSVIFIEILLHKYRCWLVLTAGLKREEIQFITRQFTRAVINLLLNYIYTLSGPSNHHEKKYLATARIEDIYKKCVCVSKWL